MKKMIVSLSFIALIFAACGHEENKAKVLPTEESLKAAYANPDDSLGLSGFEGQGLMKSVICEMKCIAKKADCDSHGYSFCQSIYELCSGICKI